MTPATRHDRRTLRAELAQIARSRGWTTTEPGDTDQWCMLGLWHPHHLARITITWQHHTAPVMRLETQAGRAATWHMHDAHETEMRWAIDAPETLAQVARICGNGHTDLIDLTVIDLRETK